MIACDLSSMWKEEGAFPLLIWRYRVPDQGLGGLAPL